MFTESYAEHREARHSRERLHHGFALSPRRRAHPRTTSTATVAIAADGSNSTASIAAVMYAQLLTAIKPYIVSVLFGMLVGAFTVK